MTFACIGCEQRTVVPLLDLGPQPPSNRFLQAPDTEVERHPLRVGECSRCGLVQLIDPMPTELTRPRMGWLAYNEPEAHLDAVCDRIRALPGLPAQMQLLGVSYKDDSTLARLAQHGAQTRRLDMASDWNVREPHAQLESLQRAATATAASALAQRYGAADVVIVRHLLEHAHEPRRFIDAMLRLTKPGGYVVFEVPAAEKMLANGDHCLLWEEHAAYFTEATLAALFAYAQLPVELWRYPFALEDSLIAVVRNTTVQTIADVKPGQQPGAAFAAHFEPLRTAYQHKLSGWRAQQRHTAVFGAGHLALKFINFYGLSGLIDCVIDDNLRKQGTYLPGSGLPVVGSQVLRKGLIDFCLLALNPDRELAVMASQPEFAAHHGTFYSIFRCSPIALHPLSASRQ